MIFIILIVVSGYSNYQVALWDLDLVPDGAVTAGGKVAAFSPNGRYAAMPAANRRALDLLDLETGKKTRLRRPSQAAPGAEPPKVSAVAFSANSERFLAFARNTYGTPASDLAVWETGSGRCLREEEYPGADERIIFLGSDRLLTDQGLLIPLAPDPTIPAYSFPNFPLGQSFAGTHLASLNGGELLLLIDEYEALTLRRGTDGQVLFRYFGRTSFHGYSVICPLAERPAALVSCGGEWFLLKAGGEVEFVPLSVPFPDGNLAVSPDGRRLASFSSLDYYGGVKLELYEDLGRRRRRTVTVPDVVLAVGFTADSRRVLAAADDGRIYYWDFEPRPPWLYIIAGAASGLGLLIMIIRAILHYLAVAAARRSLRRSLLRRE